MFRKLYNSIRYINKLFTLISTFEPLNLDKLKDYSTEKIEDSDLNSSLIIDKQQKSIEEALEIYEERTRTKITENVDMYTFKSLMADSDFLQSLYVLGTLYGIKDIKEIKTHVKVNAYKAKLEKLVDTIKPIFGIILNNNENAIKANTKTLIINELDSIIKYIAFNEDPNDKEYFVKLSNGIMETIQQTHI